MILEVNCLWLSQNTDDVAATVTFFLRKALAYFIGPRFKTMILWNGQGPHQTLSPPEAWRCCGRMLAHIHTFTQSNARIFPG